MSDEHDNPDSSSSGSGMTTRLQSLRASIRASKAAKDTAETTEQVSPTLDTQVDAPTVSSPTAISSSQSLPAYIEDDDDDDLPDGPVTDDGYDDFNADDTQMMSTEELEAETDEPPRRPFRDSGEKFNTDDLHRVRPSVEAAVLGEFASGGLLAQMDQASEASADEETSGFGDPTIIQSIEDFAFVQGTPLYMSPEQCRDEAVDPGTDVYSLGVMMFELLEGFPPYVAETIDEVLLMHQDAPIPEQKSQFTPPAVRELVARMLAKRPEERPSVAEVIETLQQFAAIGGPDVLGLEEESWTVSEVEESEPALVAPLQQLARAPDENTLDTAAPSNDKLPHIGLVVAFGIVLLVSTVVVVAMTFSGSDDEPEEPQVVVAEEPKPDPEPQPEPEVVEEPTEPEEPVEPMEFGAADVDAGSTDDAGTSADAGTGDEAAVEEAPKPEPKKKKKRKRRKRRKPPKKEELRELRLDL